MKDLSTNRRANRAIPVAIVVIVGLLFMLAPVSAQTPLAAQTESRVVAEAYQNSFRQVARMALPVVVKIDVVAVVERPVSQGPFGFGRDPNADPSANELRRPALGSGVLVRRAGDKVYVLTNEHVVGTAEEISITLNDGRQFDATLVGKDSDRDLAVVVFETTEEVPIASLGDSDKLFVGDWAFAVGTPLGFQATFTAGIISALGRQQPVGSSFSGFTDYIQTDAAINSGNSGGALVNLAGEVVGINTWIASRTGDSIGLGFAIPINNAKRVIDQLVATGVVENGWLGVSYGGPLSKDLLESLKVSTSTGALVGSIFVGSPAARAGILPGDVITQIDGEKISDWDDLRRIVANVPAGSSLPFRVVRDADTLDLRVRLARRDAESGSSGSWPGFTVLPITDEIRDGLSLGGEPGTVVVANVEPGSPAAAAGLRRGDIVRKIGNLRVEDIESFYDFVNGDGELNLSIVRGENDIEIDVIR